MYVPGEKISQLIAYYGKSKNYSAAKYLKKFTEDHNLNYTQWSAYCKPNGENAGIKVLAVLIKIFPQLNLNWVFKDDYNMMETDPLSMVSEPDGYSKQNYEKVLLELDRLKNKLDSIHKLSEIDV